MSNWRFEWITRWEEVWDPPFIEQWKAWIAGSPSAHVFFEPSVVQAWFEAYVPLLRMEPRFLVATLGSECMVFLPLVYFQGGWKDAWQRAIRPAGFIEFDYHDPILVGEAEGDVWLDFWKALERELAATWGGAFEEIFVPRLREPVIANDPPGPPVDEVPWVDLSPYASLDQFLAGGRRRNLRYYFHKNRKALESGGKLRYHLYGPQEFEGARGSVFRLMEDHSRRWPDASTPHSFYENLVRFCLPEGILHVSELLYDSEPIFWQLNLYRAGRIHLFTQAFYQPMAAYSPGKLHYALLLEWAIQHQVQVIDLGRGKEKYKLWWADGTFPLYCWQRREKGLRSRLSGMWQDSIRPVATKAKRTLFKRQAPFPGRDEGSAL